ncbi:LOW QUALITY PROTEIN: CtaG protein [Geomicrobium sp. JCM 19037]|nr:LOW QUALITY PROTEIN: CtaG protein [Geomicrobium sp. JCM 19037]
MGEVFEVLSFRALWTPELIAVLLIIGALYFLLTRRWRTRFTSAGKQTFKQDLMFVTGLVCLYLGWGSPLYSVGHMMVSIHMIQMVFAYFLAVPLFILALPKWLLAGVYNWLDKKVQPLRMLIFHPIIGLIFFNALFSIYHIPVVFDFLMLTPGVHSVYEMVMFVAAIMMWWHMLAPLPSKQYLHDFRRIIYIFGNGILITPACALIIFSGTALYDTYTDMSFWAQVMAYCIPGGAAVPASMFGGPGVLGGLDAYSDQQLGGVAMKVGQELVYGTTIGFVFKQWLQKESHQDGELTISDIPSHIKTGER